MKPLSEKIFDKPNRQKLLVEDVKEAIQRLKDEAIHIFGRKAYTEGWNKMQDLIDKIFGKELTK